MAYFNRVLGRDVATFECPSFAQIFPEVESVVRATYQPNEGHSVRIAKGKNEWTIFVHKGLTTGFRIDFVPVPVAFSTPELVVRVSRSSCLAVLAYYLMCGPGLGAIGGGCVASFLGWWAGVKPVFVFAGILAGVALLLTPPTIAGLCMYVGGRLTDNQLTDIGRLVTQELQGTGAIDHLCPQQHA